MINAKVVMLNEKGALAFPNESNWIGLVVQSYFSKYYTRVRWHDENNNFVRMNDVTDDILQSVDVLASRLSSIDPII